MSNLTNESMEYIVARLLERAAEAAKESRADPDNMFEAGRRMAYYEMLDILKTELYVHDQDLREYGLDINLETTIA